MIWDRYINIQTLGKTIKNKKIIVFGVTVNIQFEKSILSNTQ